MQWLNSKPGSQTIMHKVAIIGGGPAGLRTAQICGERGLDTLLFDQKRSVGRKFLIAGKSGLNLTNDATPEHFLNTYKGVDPTLWQKLYAHFDNHALRQWAADLGQDTFVSSGKKVFPKSMKAAPLLRAWVKQIKASGVSIQTQHRLLHITPLSHGYRLTFDTPEDTTVDYEAEQIVLALGGGSWPQTGSDGAWTTLMNELGVPVTPLCAANCGWTIPWPKAFIDQHDGAPWKNVLCSAGTEEILGELRVTHYGLEGGPIYRLGHALRQLPSPILTLDFKPSFSVHQLIRKAESVRSDLENNLAQRWKLCPSTISLLSSEHPTVFSKAKITSDDLIPLATSIKEFHLPLSHPRPIEEAISSAGGVNWEALTPQLELAQYPGIYLAGEMINWEAPTGGFLLQACFATASWVAESLS